MPRAFLIKKKRAVDVQGLPDGEMNNNKGGSNSGSNSHASRVENKENLQTLEPAAKDSLVWKDNQGREAIKDDDVIRERTQVGLLEAEEDGVEAVPGVDEEGRDEGHGRCTDYLAGTLPSSTTYTSSCHGDDAVQQFPTDLSVKSTSPSARQQQQQQQQDHHRHPHHAATTFLTNVPSPTSFRSAPPHPPPSPPTFSSRPARPEDPERMGPGVTFHQEPQQQRHDVLKSRSPARPVEEASAHPAPRCSMSQPPALKPAKRPSDFSTAFLLSHHSSTKRPCPPAPFSASSTSPSTSPSSIYTESSIARPFHETSVEDLSPTTALTGDAQKLGGADERVSSKLPHAGTPLAPLIPPAFKYTPPCQSVSTWLDGQPTSAALASAYEMCRNREDRTSSSSSPGLEAGPNTAAARSATFTSPLGLRRGDDPGPSAFRRSDARHDRRPSSPGISRSPLLSSSSPAATSSGASARSRSVSSPRSAERSPSRERHVPSTSPRDSVFVSPHELLAMTGAGSGSGFMSRPRSRPLSGWRRGTSTSPATSERASSGCESPDSPQDETGPEPLRRYHPHLPADHPLSFPHHHLHPSPPVSWGPHQSSSPPASSPFLPPGTAPFPPLGLPYLPGMPGFPPALPPKPLPDLGPLGLSPKALSENLASAFRASRAPFLQPPSVAAAAYYSSLRGALPYPFPFPSSMADRMADKAAQPRGEDVDVQQMERLRAMRKSPLDVPLPGFHHPAGFPRSPVSGGGGDKMVVGSRTAAVAPSVMSSSSISPPSSSSASSTPPTPRLSPHHAFSPAGVSAPFGVGRASSDLGLSEEDRRSVEELARSITKFSAFPGLPSPPSSAHGPGSPLSSPPSGLGLGLGKGVRGGARGKEPQEPVRYQCEACSKSYSTYSGLSKHRQFHCAAQVKKEFSCKQCDKTYVSLGALKMHIRTHTLPCKCQVCGKAFSRPWLLQGHVRTHTGEKPFSCPHCARAFADRSNLRAHLQTHSDVKKYSCRHCAKTFSRMSLLVKHEDGCTSVIA